MLRVFILLLLTHHALSFSSGAPLEACRSLMPMHSAMPSSGVSPYRVIVEGSNYTPGQPLNVLLESTDGSSFRGFLIVARAIGSRTNVGTFQGRGTTEGRWIQQACDNKTLTHTAAFSLAARGKPRLELRWIPPLDIESDALFMVTFVKEKTQFWIALRSEIIQKGEATTISTTRSTTTPTTPSTTTPTTSTPTTPTTTSTTTSTTSPTTTPTATSTIPTITPTATIQTTKPTTTPTVSPMTTPITTATITANAQTTSKSGSITEISSHPETTSRANEMTESRGTTIIIAPDATAAVQSANQTRKRRGRKRRTTPNPDGISSALGLKAGIITSICISALFLL